MSQPKDAVLASALSPFERGAEIIFGILMAISVTAAAEITLGAEVDVRELMLAALGCNLAWGLIDAVIYLLQLQFERHRVHRMVLELRAIQSDDAFRERQIVERLAFSNCHSIGEIPRLRGPARQHEIAEARKAHERFRSCAKGGGDAAQLDKAARHQSGMGAGAKPCAGNGAGTWIRGSNERSSRRMPRASA